MLLDVAAPCRARRGVRPGARRAGRRARARPTPARRSAGGPDRAAPAGSSGSPTSRGSGAPRPGRGRPGCSRSAAMKSLKYLNSRWVLGERAPATLRRVWVNEREPVACTTVRPRRASSPSSDRAMTLLPLPGPPVTSTTLLLSARAGALDLVQHQVVRQPLVAEQHELLPPLHLVRRHRQQLPARRGRRAEELVGVRRPGHVGVQVVGEELQPVAAPGPGEQPAVARPAGSPTGPRPPPPRRRCAGTRRRRRRPAGRAATG